MMHGRWLGLVVLTFGLASLGLWVGINALQPDLVLTRGPYVMNQTTASIIIAWRTNRPVDGRVEYGPTPAYGGAVSHREPSTHHALTLTGLLPDTPYHYRVAGGGRPLSEAYTFRTSRDETTPYFTFAVLGDSGRGGRQQYAVAKRIQAIRPDFVLHTGDVIYPAGEAKDFEAKYFQPYRDLITRIPFFLTLGNHDVATANGRPYLDAFHLPSNNPERTERYYSFEYGNARFIALDSNQPPGPGGPMYTWLSTELQRGRKFWTFAFFHHAPYSSGKHGSNLLIRKAWSPLFERALVAVVFSGHDHTYERTVPIRDFDQRGPGVVYVVTGGGGADLYPVGRSAWTAHAASIHHVLRAEVRDCALDLQAIAADGEVFDRATIDRCGERPGTAPGRP